MTINTGIKLAETIVKKPAVGEIVGYGIIGFGVFCTISGIGVVHVTHGLQN